MAKFKLPLTARRQSLVRFLVITALLLEVVNSYVC